LVKSITSDWSDRETDVLFVDIGTPVMSSMRRSRLAFGDTIRVVAGVQKAVQKYVSILFTRLGSSVAPIGTGFMAAVGTGNVRTEADLSSRFQFESNRAIVQANLNAFRADERIRSVVLLKAIVELQRLSLQVRLTTDAGEEAVFLAPVER
jgi:hypothetical protein